MKIFLLWEHFFHAPTLIGIYSSRAKARARQVRLIRRDKRRGYVGISYTIKQRKLQ